MDSADRRCKAYRVLLAEFGERRFGDTFWLVIQALVLEGLKFKSRAALAEQVGVSRQRIKVILDYAVQEGVLEKNPFKPQPQMARAWSRRRSRDQGPD